MPADGTSAAIAHMGTSALPVIGSSQRSYSYMMLVTCVGGFV